MTRHTRGYVERRGSVARLEGGRMALVFQAGKKDEEMACLFSGKNNNKLQGLERERGSENKEWSG